MIKRQNCNIMARIQICPDCGLIHGGEHDFLCTFFEDNPWPDEVKWGIRPWRSGGSLTWELCEPREWSYIG